MSTTRASAGTETELPEELERDVVLDVLSNKRRRFVVHYLKRQDGNRVSDSELAKQVASWESDKPVAELDYTDRKRVRNALRQFHLPKMDEMGFVEYDEREGTAALSPAASEEDFYVDVLPKRGIPWGLYYLGLSIVVSVILVGTVLSVPPFSLLPPEAWCLFVSTGLLVSSLGHFYDNYYRMRLGARETPPEVGES
jgi:hypothetical protein